MDPGRAARTLRTSQRTARASGAGAAPRTVRRAVRRALLHTADGVHIDARYEPRAVDVTDVLPSTEPAAAPVEGVPADGATPARADGTGRNGAHAGVAGAGVGIAEATGNGGPTTLPPSTPDPVIVIAHGFTGDLDRPHVRRIAHAFARHAAVVTFSFRGHGRSGGRSTVGDREVLDLAAAVAWARRLGHRRVITVGFSMGGSVVLRHAALHRRGTTVPAPQTAEPNAELAAEPTAEPAAELARDQARDLAGELTGDLAGELTGDLAGELTGQRTGDVARKGSRKQTGKQSAERIGKQTAVPSGEQRVESLRGGRTEAWTDAVVSVSSPARWYYRGTAPMRRLHWMVTRPEGRIVGRYGFRTRIHGREWNPVPLSPVAAAALIGATPLLIVHGDRDGYFPLDHPRMLAEAAQGAGELWLEPGMGHAESASSAGLLERIAVWGVEAVGAMTRPVLP